MMSEATWNTRNKGMCMGGFTAGESIFLLLHSSKLGCLWNTKVILLSTGAFECMWLNYI